MPRGITTKTVIKKIFDIPGIIHLYINSWLVMLEKRSDAIFRYSNGREIIKDEIVDFNGKYSGDFNLKGNAPGLYLVNISQNGKTNR